MEFNDNSNWSEMLAKKKEFYQRMKEDLEFRLTQVDKKIRTLNALSGYAKYNRYQEEVYDDKGTTYLIGKTGEFIQQDDE